jgi:hypothetical protein
LFSMSMPRLTVPAAAGTEDPGAPLAVVSEEELQR